MSYTVIRYLRSREQQQTRYRSYQIYDSEFDCAAYETRAEALAAEVAAWKKGADEVKVFAGEEVDLCATPADEAGDG
jgi:hypothetical protein